MLHWNGSPGPLPIGVQGVAEGDHANRVIRGCGRVASGQQLLCEGRSLLGGTATEAHERDFENDRIPHRSVQPRSPFLDLADDHVRPICRTTEDWIGNTVAQCSPSSSTDQIVASICKSEHENVEIRDSSGMVATIGLENRILRHGEVSVDVKVRLHESDGRIHATPYERSAADSDGSAMVGMLHLTSIVTMPTSARPATDKLFDFDHRDRSKRHQQR